MHAVLCVLIAIAVAVAPRASAQATRGTISGSVIDARTGASLPHATATLTPADGLGVLLDARGTTSSFAIARTVTTSVDGTYRFADLPIGAYHLRIQRLGYEPATIDVRLGDTGTSPLSIGLIVLPVRLRAVEVRAHDSSTAAGEQSTGSIEDARLAAAHARQRTFLSTDARELTLADIAESATLGGSDVLRSLLRLPGVTPLDDWSAKLWVRGNRWDHNRTYFDGLPLFDPLGVLGRTSGVSADAIGGAFLHPGVRPVSLGGDGATRIDLRSRPASVGGAWRGSAELSPFGASGAIERTLADTSAGILVTAHRSLGAWLPRDLFSEALAGRSYFDEQATARGDIDLGDGKRIEASGLFTRDARTLANEPDGDETNQVWRNGVSRVTFSSPVGPFVTSHTVGISQFASSSDRYVAQSPTDPVMTIPVTSSVEYVTVGGQIGSRAATRDASTVGYDLIMQRTSIHGTQQTLVTNPVVRRGELDYGAVWADRRNALGSVTLENGVRLDVGGGHGLDALRPAASTQAVVVVSPNTRLSIGASRVHEYIQGVDLPLVGQSQTLPTSWLTSGNDVPVMAVDNAMAGIEQWMGTAVLMAANVYVRHTVGDIADDPTPGPLFGRPLFVEATESAHGIEVSARKLIGRSTGLIAYSYGSATMHANGLSFPASADRTHSFDATMSLHLGSVNLGGAYTLASGAPYTRTVPAAALGQPGGSQILVREAPNAQRLPAYSSLDVSVDYARVIGGVALGAFGGMQNLLGRKNSTWYEISGYCENGQSQPVVSPQCANHDVLEAPVKRSLTVGLRLVVR